MMKNKVWSDSPYTQEDLELFRLDNVRGTSQSVEASVTRGNDVEFEITKYLLTLATFILGSLSIFITTSEVRSSLNHASTVGLFMIYLLLLISLVTGILEMISVRNFQKKWTMIGIARREIYTKLSLKKYKDNNEAHDAFLEMQKEEEAILGLNNINDKIDSSSAVLFYLQIITTVLALVLAAGLFIYVVF